MELESLAFLAKRLFSWWNSGKFIDYCKYNIRPSFHLLLDMLNQRETRYQLLTIQKDILYKELYLKTFIKGNCETVKLFFQGNYSWNTDLALVS